MKKIVGISFILVLFVSCTKDPDPNMVVDEHLGNYSCMKIVYSVGPDSSGNLVNLIDTSDTDVIIKVESWKGNNYQVLGTDFSFVTSSFLLGKYTASCPNGPCPTLTFYAADSILVTRKIANPISMRYVGKKQ